jgi:DNA-binding HxlR family transcriptional regulator
MSTTNSNTTLQATKKNNNTSRNSRKSDIKQEQHITEVTEFRIGDKAYHSALDITLDIVGSKWKILVLWSLRDGAKRFTELSKSIPDITEKMLSLQLKQLEHDRIIEREVFAEVPPRVQYSLSPEGTTILPMLQAMVAWGQQKADTAAALALERRTGTGRMSNKAASVPAPSRKRSTRV